MTCYTRRVLMGATLASAVTGLAWHARADVPGAGEDAFDLVRRLLGRRPIESARLRLSMPAQFPTGYVVPLTLTMASPMSVADHVRRFHVLAPANPIVEVARFDFAPERSEPQVSTRIRLSAPQFVLALAELSDDTLLLARTYVEVASDGCS